MPAPGRNPGHITPVSLLFSSRWSVIFCLLLGVLYGKLDAAIVNLHPEKDMREESPIRPDDPPRRTPQSGPTTALAPALIYREGIRIPSDSLKKKEPTFSAPRCSKVSGFIFCARRPLPTFPLCFAILPKINRHTEKIETPVSYRKQRTAPPINRHISQAPRFPFSLFTFPFFPCPMELPVSFTTHSPLLTSHCISNRKLEILEPHLSPALSTNHPVLIANFEPSESSSFRPTFLPHTLLFRSPTSHGPVFPIFPFPL
jgi:hypothetical protein